MDDVVFMVRGKTRALAERYMGLVCDRIGAEQTSRPSDGTGRGWVVRAVIRDASADDEPAAETPSS